MISYFDNPMSFQIDFYFFRVFILVLIVFYYYGDDSISLISFYFCSEFLLLLLNFQLLKLSWLLCVCVNFDYLNVDLLINSYLELFYEECLEEDYYFHLDSGDIISLVCYKNDALTGVIYTEFRYFYFSKSIIFLKCVC